MNISRQKSLSGPLAALFLIQTLAGCAGTVPDLNNNAAPPSGQPTSQNNGRTVWRLDPNAQQAATSKELVRIVALKDAVALHVNNTFTEAGERGNFLTFLQGIQALRRLHMQGNTGFDREAFNTAFARFLKAADDFSGQKGIHIADRIQTYLGRHFTQEEVLNLAFFVKIYEYVQENSIVEGIVFDQDDLSTALTSIARTLDGETLDRDDVIMALNKVFERIDPHYGTFNKDKTADLKIMMNANVSGVGMEIRKDGQGRIVVVPLKDSPAMRAGIKEGDIITHVDGTLYSDDKEVAKHVRGPVGTPVALTVLREGEAEPLTFTLVREKVEINPTKTRLLGNGIGYLRLLNFFGEKTDEKFEDAVHDLQKSGPLNGLIIDLRNNPGGRLEKAANIADGSLKDALIVFTKGRKKEEDETFRATPHTFIPDDTPIVVLINRNSASASEIFAAAMQDHHRAVLMGEKSFEKGSAQKLLFLPEGEAQKTTGSLFFRPDGSTTHNTGVTPSVFVYVQDEDTVNAKRESDRPNILSVSPDLMKPDLTRPLVMCVPEDPVVSKDNDPILNYAVEYLQNGGSLDQNRTCRASTQEERKAYAERPNDFEYPAKTYLQPSTPQ